MSSFVIKLIAIITMVIDHSNYFFIKNIILNFIGRIAFPLFAYQVVVGYSKTKSLKKYVFRMFIFALISQIPFYLFIKAIGGDFAINVIATLTLGLVVMYIYDLRIENKNNRLVIIDKNDNNLLMNIEISSDKILCVFFNFIKIILISVILVFSEILKVDYEWWGVLLILFIKVCYPFDGSIDILGKNVKINSILNKFIFTTGMLLLCIIRYLKYIPNVKLSYIILYIIFTFVPTIIMLLHNGKKGKSMKYFFYIFYPVQFAVLLIINYIVHS